MRRDTRSRGFSKAVKMEIAERDSFDGWPCCIYCGEPASEMLAFSNAHFISRAQGGLGVAENGLTLCPQCHRRYDQSTDRQAMQDTFREYLQGKYSGWNEDSLIQRRGLC